VRNVVNKLGVDTRTQAVAIATRYSFLDRDPEKPPTAR
jgi:DNA-binding NarL/FixJ family response regulator